jgi:hypothetical protein
LRLRRLERVCRWRSAPEAGSRILDLRSLGASGSDSASASRQRGQRFPKRFADNGALHRLHRLSDFMSCFPRNSPKAPNFRIPSRLRNKESPVESSKESWETRLSGRCPFVSLCLYSVEVIVPFVGRVPTGGASRESARNQVDSKRQRPQGEQVESATDTLNIAPHGSGVLVRDLAVTIQNPASCSKFRAIFD